MADARSIRVPAAVFPVSAGTWSLAVAAHVISYDKAAAADHPIIYIPLPNDSVSESYHAFVPASVDVLYSLGTDAPTSVTIELYKDTFGTDGTLESSALVITTKDTDAAGRKVLDEQVVNLAINTPEMLDGNESYHVEIAADCAAGTVLKIFGVRVNYA